MKKRLNIFLLAFPLCPVFQIQAQEKPNLVFIMADQWRGDALNCGDVLNFKTYSKSYKNKKRIHNDPENWVVFQDVHEPIIERAVFEQVQQKRGKMRKRRTSNGEHNMFSGLLVCADCGCNLHFHFNQGNPEIKYFNCSNYKGNRGTCTSFLTERRMHDENHGKEAVRAAQARPQHPPAFREAVDRVHPQH